MSIKARIDFSALPRRAAAFVVLVLVAVAGLTGAVQTARAQQQDGGLGIAAVVNDDVISMLDLQLRINMVVNSSNMQNTAETRARVAPQVLRGMIDEKLMLQEAHRVDIQATQSEIDDGVENIARQNDGSVEDLRAVMDRWGVPMSALRARIEAEVAWGKFVGRNLARNITIGEEEIDDEIARIRSNAGRPEYLLAEIVLPVDKPDQESEVRKLAGRLLQQMQNGAAFNALAQNFSRAPSSAVGGDLGWVQAGHLDPKIIEAVRKLEPGQVTPPLRTLGGYSLILLRDKRTSPGLVQGGATLRVSQLHLRRQSDDPGAEAALKARLNELTRDVNGCDALEAVGEREGSPLSGGLGEVNTKSLPANMRKVLQDLPAGRLSAPVETGGGFAVMMVCERTEQAVDMDAVRKRIEDELHRERLNVAAQRQLRDLRRAAFVDTRL